MIWRAYKAGGRITEKDLMDGNLEDDETQRVTDTFKSLLDYYHREHLRTFPIKKDEGVPWPLIVRKAMFSTFWGDLMYAVIFAFLAESITVTYVYCLVYLFEYIKDEEAPATKGVWLCFVYGAAVVIAAICRNYYIFLGYRMAIRLRKAIVSAMYDKVGKLSNKSLTETNSGKLITIISGDIF
jgi:ABC-type multidrug transport system fused ATPase/permease subunit